MLNTHYFDDLARKLLSALPSSFQTLQQECRQQFKDILQTAFNELNLVTREEFDVQVKVLARTREKLEALQAQVDALASKE